jgi:hypothetical protein
VDVIDIKDDSSDIPIEHKILLDERLKRVEEGKTTFKNWDLVKRKYEGKAI